jgi:hypothetical protein
VVRHRGRAFRSAPLSAHVAYLERDGVTRDGDKGRTFGAAEDRADAVPFARRGLNDRHHCRFGVTPEDAAEMTDLRAFTRELAVQMESDLGTRLDWVGIAHWNTDNPRVHLVVRGVADDVPISSSRAITSATACARGRQTWSRPSSAPGPSMKSAPLARGRWKQSAGRASTRRSMAADDIGFIDLRPDNRARAIRRRAVSPSADCRSWSAGVSPRLQGQANG